MSGTLPGSLEHTATSPSESLMKICVRLVGDMEMPKEPDDSSRAFMFSNAMRQVWVLDNTHRKWRELNQPLPMHLEQVSRAKPTTSNQDPMSAYYAQELLVEQTEVLEVFQQNQTDASFLLAFIAMVFQYAFSGTSTFLIASLTRPDAFPNSPLAKQIHSALSNSLITCRQDRKEFHASLSCILTEVSSLLRTKFGDGSPTTLITLVLLDLPGASYYLSVMPFAVKRMNNRCSILPPILIPVIYTWRPDRGDTRYHLILWKRAHEEAFSCGARLQNLDSHKRCCLSGRALVCSSLAFEHQCVFQRGVPGTWHATAVALLEEAIRYLIVLQGEDFYVARHYKKVVQYWHRKYERTKIIETEHGEANE
ncbi:hypothetical protein MKZ38_004408 [Zalerion maritima]|uniref:Uncharacterized protein n=1 Tax=Zalerion maritima TaxID=339359 RepID=A0AAD5WPJ2_9PEZI|nr:hypothetical protein MKZ38_004408 [Zalerion maritima]